jgi:hypothetical protein
MARWPPLKRSCRVPAQSGFLCDDPNDELKNIFTRTFHSATPHVVCPRCYKGHWVFALRIAWTIHCPCGAMLKLVRIPPRPRR